MKTILVVEDEELIRELTARFLENLSMGLTVLTAENGAEAIDMLKTGKVDLVLTDINMPVMDGFTLLKYISVKHPDILSIAMTAFQSREITEKLGSLGVKRVFQKPFDLHLLKDEIFCLLGKDNGKPWPACLSQPLNSSRPALNQVTRGELYEEPFAC